LKIGEFGLPRIAELQLLSLPERLPQALRREIDEVRHSAIAFDDGEFDTEVGRVATPVRDFGAALTAE